MQKTAYAAVAAALLAYPANAADLITSTIAMVDAKRHTVTLTDKTIIEVAKDVDLSQVKPGMKVAIAAYGDEDGFEPATAITPVQ